MSKEDTYDVGYKKPPKKTRYKKGDHGNPYGRPKGTRNFKTDLIEELSEKVTLKEGGRPKSVSKQRAFIKSLMAKAINGEGRAPGLLAMLTLKLLQDVAPETAVTFGPEDLAILDRFRTRVAREVGEEAKSAKPKSKIR